MVLQIVVTVICQLIVGKHLYKEIEAFSQPSALLKVKELVDKDGQPKTMIQRKKQLKEFKRLL